MFSSEERKSETGGIPIPFSIPYGHQNGEANATPDFQVYLFLVSFYMFILFQFTPFVVQGGTVIGGTGPMHPLGSTPTGANGYGYGSWNAVYANGTVPSGANNSNNLNNSLSSMS